MELSDLSKPSKTQDKSNYPSKKILASCESLGYLPRSKHEVLFLETKNFYYFYSFDIDSLEGFGTKVPCSCYVQTHKGLNSNFCLTEAGNFPQICWTYVPTFYQGKGFAIEMYEFLINRFNGIWSDVKHTEGAKRLWSKVCQNVNVDLMNFDNNGKEQILITNTSETDSGIWYSDKKLLLFAHHNTHDY